MPRYDAPIRDMQFIFHDVLALQNYSNLEGFSDATPDIVDQILETGGKFASEVLFPLNKVGDAQGCKRAEDASVKTPDGFPDAYKQFVEDAGNGRTGPAQRALDCDQRNDVISQYGFRDVSGPDLRRV